MGYARRECLRISLYCAAGIALCAFRVTYAAGAEVHLGELAVIGGLLGRIKPRK